MIISRRGLWALGLMVLGGQGHQWVAGMHMRDDGSTTASQTVAAQATASDNGNSATVSPVYFESAWDLGNGNFQMGVPFNINYSLEVPTSAALSMQFSLPLALLWTNATGGVPDSTNTWQLMQVQCRFLE